MKISLYIKLDGDYFKREVDWPAVPREGESVQLTEGGWTERVQRIFWGLDGSAQLEFRDTLDGLGEDLAGSLRAAGWS